MHRFLLLVTPSSLHFSHLEMQLHRADRQRGGSTLRRINGNTGILVILQLHLVPYFTAWKSKPPQHIADKKETVRVHPLSILLQLQFH